MTLFQSKRFTVPASAGTKQECQRVGHAWADKKGRCVRCGDAIDSKAPREAVNK